MIHIQTNGLRFSDLGFTRGMAAAGLTDVELPLYGKAGTHDKIVRYKNSYELIMRALKNLNKFSISVTLHTLLLRQNKKDMSALRDTFDNMIINFPRPISTLDDPLNYKKFCVKLSEIPSDIKKAMDLNIPCLFGERKPARHRKEGVEIRFDGPDRLRRGAPATEQKNKPAKCRTCKFYAHCDGIFPLYLKAYGDGEFRPVL